MRSLLLAAVLVGCAPLPSIRWAPDDFPRIDIPAIPEPSVPADAVQTSPGRVELAEPVVDYLMDVEGLFDPARGAIDLCYEGREADIAEAMVVGVPGNWEQYQLLVGEIRGLAYAREELKALLERTTDDVEETLSS